MAEPAAQQPRPEAAEPSSNEYARRARRIFEALGYAGLDEALFVYSNKKPRLLMARGLKGGKHFLKSVTQDRPKEGFGYLVEFLRTITGGAVAKFMEKEGANRNQLRESLISFGVASRARMGKRGGREEPFRSLTLLYLDAWTCGEEYMSCLQAADSVAIHAAKRVDSTRKACLASLAALENPVTSLDIIEKSKDYRNDPVCQLEIMLMAMFAALRFGPPADAEKLSARLDRLLKGAGWEQSERMRGHLADFYEQHRPQGRINARRIFTAEGVQIQDVTRIEVLVHCRLRHDDNPAMNKREVAFSDVVAIKEASSDEWLELPTEAAKRLFPPRGRIVHFAGARFPPLPHKDEYAVYRVDEHDVAPENVDEHEKVHAQRRVMPAHVVASLEDIASRDTEALRDKLEELAGHQREHEHSEKIIHLSDGLFAKPPKGLVALARDGFATKLEAWEKLDIIQLSSGLNMHVGEVPDTQRFLDLGAGHGIIHASIKQHNRLGAAGLKRLRKALQELAKNERAVELMREMQHEGWLTWPCAATERLIAELCERPETKPLLASLHEGADLDQEKDRLAARQRELQEECQRSAARIRAALAKSQEIDQRIDDSIEKRYLERERARLLRIARNREERHQAVHRSIPKIRDDLHATYAGLEKKLGVLEGQLRHLDGDGEKAANGAVAGAEATAQG